MIKIAYIQPIIQFQNKTISIDWSNPQQSEIPIVANVINSNENSPLNVTATISVNGITKSTVSKTITNTDTIALNYLPVNGEQLSFRVLATDKNSQAVSETFKDFQVCNCSQVDKSATCDKSVVQSEPVPGLKLLSCQCSFSYTGKKKS